MGLWDSISSGFSAMGGWNTLGNIANVAGSAFDIYQGVQSMNMAEKYADLAFGSAAKQDEYSQAMWDRMKSKYWPIEDLNIQYSMEDMKTLRPMYEQQIAYQAQRGQQELANAKEMDPLIDETKKSLIRKLTEGEDVLRGRMTEQASTDTSAAFEQQRGQDARRMGMAGINPNSGQYANYMNRMGTNEAMSEATARTQASRLAEDTALSRQSQALNYYSTGNLPQYQYTPTVNAGTVQQGLGGSTGNYMGGMQYFGNQAQNQFTGASYQLNQLTKGNLG